MLGRLINSGTRCLVQRQILRARYLSITPVALGGGHHDIPVPEPYVPQPRKQGEKDWLGREKLPRLTTDSHDHTADDFKSYIGAGFFVLLTLGAVAFYTDVFGMNIKENFKHVHHRPFTPAPTKETSSKKEELSSKHETKAVEVEKPSTKVESKVEAKSTPTEPKRSSAKPSDSSETKVADASVVEKISEAVKEEVRQVTELASEAVASVEATVEKALHKVEAVVLPPKDDPAPVTSSDNTAETEVKPNEEAKKPCCHEKKKGECDQKGSEAV